jgi:predicted nucleotidyltransferase
MNQKDHNFYDVLVALSNNGLNEKLILVGGWCLAIYQHEFNDDRFPVKPTQDIDLLIRNPFPKLMSILIKF